VITVFEMIDRKIILLILFVCASVSYVFAVLYGGLNEFTTGFRGTECKW
jgi:hypothetical protein